MIGTVNLHENTTICNQIYYTYSLLFYLKNSRSATCYYIFGTVSERIL